MSSIYESSQSPGRRPLQSDNHLSRIAARQRELEAELTAARKANRGKPDRKRWYVTPPAAQEDEGWFTTYLDVMTLLLVLLVVMLSYSGKNAVGSLKQALSESPAQVALIPPLGELPVVVLDPISTSIGLIPGSNGFIPEIGLHHHHLPRPEDASPPQADASHENAAPTATDREVTASPALTESNNSLPPGDTTLNEEVALAEGNKPLSPVEPSATVEAASEPAAPTAESKPAAPAPAAQDMLAGLPLSDLGDDIDIIVNERSVSFRINSEILFSSGQAELSLEGLSVLKRLIPVFNSVKHQITIEGHTDSVPMLRNRQYPSNWELSGARAGSVVRYLQANGIASTRLRAVGNADTRPLADNSTPKGRATNRRVELIMERPDN